MRNGLPTYSATGCSAPASFRRKRSRELRDLTRYRRKLVESQTAERNRLLKLLETANIKLSSVVCDVFGVSGQLMLPALLKGEASPPEMAQLAKGRLGVEVRRVLPSQNQDQD